MGEESRLPPLLKLLPPPHSKIELRYAMSITLRALPVIRWWQARCPANGTSSPDVAPPLLEDVAVEDTEEARLEAAVEAE